MDKERIDGFRILRVGAGYFRIVAFSYLLIFGKLGAPRYGRYRCCHRHAGFPAFEPAFDLDRLCGLPSKGSGTPAHRGDLDTVGGRFMLGSLSERQPPALLVE